MHCNHLFLFLALAVFNRWVASQSLNDIPTCAQSAALMSLSSTGCQLTDVACICNNQNFINSLAPVIEKDCNAADVQKTYKFAQGLCATVSVSLSISGYSPSTATSATITPNPTVSPTPASSTVGGSSSVSSIPASGGSNGKITASFGVIFASCSFFIGTALITIASIALF